MVILNKKNVDVNVICLPMKHQGVHKNSFRNVRAFQDRIGIWKCWFLRRGENRSTRRKTSRSREENQQQTQPTHDAGSGNRTQDTLVGGKCSHHCAIPTCLFCVTWFQNKNKKGIAACYIKQYSFGLSFLVGVHWDSLF